MAKAEFKLWKDFLAPFLVCFALTGGLFLTIRHFSRSKKFPDVAVVLSPHFDDAALSLGGFAAENLNPIIVVTFFSQKPPRTVRSGWDVLSGFKNSDEAITTRAKENELALGAVGAHSLNLNYLDFQYRLQRDGDSGEKILRAEEKDIKTLLENFTADNKISVYGPAEFGPDITHPDHQILHDAFTAVALEKIGQKNLRFFYYEDFPYAKQYAAATTTPLKDFLERQNGGVSLRETPLPLSPTALDQKIKAVAEYPSQEKAFLSQGEDIGAAARGYARGRCFALVPRPFACEVVYEIKK